MTTFLDAARQLLKGHPEGLHYEELTRQALDQGLVVTSGKTPEATMNAQLSTLIKRAGPVPEFRRVSPGTFALNPDYEPVTKIKSTAKAKQASTGSATDDEGIEGAYTGKAGEHLVAAELLFRKFNASIMPVDTGMDIVATRDGRLYNIQVKTSNLNKFQTYVFDIRVSSFERHNSSSSFYIFVLRDADHCDFLIVPFIELQKKIHEGAVRTVNDGARYRVNIKVRDGRVTLGTKEHDETYFLNNWGVIK